MIFKHETVEKQKNYSTVLVSLMVLVGLLSGVFPFVPITWAASGDISTIAGNGTSGFSGDGGPATSAQIDAPNNVFVDSAGNLYIADYFNNRIRKVDLFGTITTVAGNGTGSSTGDGGQATSASINAPTGVVVDGSGNIYITENNGHRIRKVDTGGVISTFAGTGVSGFFGDGGAAASAQFAGPADLAFDSSGNLYVADSSNNRIRKIDTLGNISTVAGTGTAGFSGDGGLATSAEINFPIGVFVDSLDNIYISDFNNFRVRKVDGSGNISTVAGVGTSGFSGDGGLATSAEFSSIYHVHVDGAGNMYISDRSNGRIRKVDTGGIVTTVAGNPAGTYPGDGGPATGAVINPVGIFVDADGNMYIGDNANDRIRFVEGSGLGVLATNPAFQANNVPPSTDIEIIFDTSLNPSTVDASTVRVWSAETGNVSGTISVLTTNVSDDTISFNPSANFRIGERIYVDVTTAVESTGGLTLSHGLMNLFFVSVAGGGASPTPLAPVAVDSSGGTPEEIYAADFDDDGDGDIAVANDNTLDILFNDGSGVMSLNASIPVSASSRQVVGADVDNNSSVDLVITDGDSVRVYKNNGSGAFSLFSSVSTGASTNPYDVIAADLDGDGDIDIAASGLSDNRVRILKNDGVGNFTVFTSYLFTGRLWGGISTDFENDGDVDLVFCSDVGGFAALLKNTGDGNFGTLEFSTGVSGNQKVDAGDVDGDGDADLFVGGSGGRVLFNNGSGVFSQGTLIPASPQLRQPVFADYNADGDLDLGFALLGGGFKLFGNDGTGGFTELYSFSGSYEPDGLTFADMNADGFVDPVVVNRSLNTLTVFLNNPVLPLDINTVTPAAYQTDVLISSNISIVFSDTIDTPSVGQASLPVFGSLTGLINGAYSFSTTTVANDTVTFNPTSDFKVGETITVVVTDGVLSTVSTPLPNGRSFEFVVETTAGNGAFASEQNPIPGNTPILHCLADFDADSFVDIAVATFGNSRIDIYLNDGSGSFPSFVSYPSATNPHDPECADLDNDGDVDIAYSDFGGARLGVIKNNGDGTFGAASHFGSVTNPYLLSSADVDADGDLDLFTSSYADIMTFFLNNGSGSFTATNYSASSGTGHIRGIDAADLTGDGILDIFVTSHNVPGNSAVKIFEGNGDGTFDAVQSFLTLTGGGGTYLKIADADQDADPDVMAFTGGLQLFKNNGDNTFSGPTIGGPSISIEGDFGDMDNDGDVDVVSTSSNDLFLHFNDGSGAFTNTSSFTINTTFATGVQVADLNNDGALDAVVMDGNNHKMAILLAGIGNAAPSATTPSSISQATNGSGYITFQTTVSDTDSDLTRLKVEYSDNGGTNYYDAELVSATPNAGTVDLNNAVAYQIGSTNAIDTDSGAKTLTIVWNSKSASNGNGAVIGEQSDIRIRVTPNDSTVDGTAQTTGNFTVDNLDPSGLTALNAGATTSSTQELTWGAVTETNFSHYEIWFGPNQSDVVNRTGTAIEWDDSDDVALATIGTTSTTITGLDPSTSYYFKIFAIDDFGNEETVTEINLSTFGEGGRRRQAIEALEPSVSPASSGGGSIPVSGGVATDTVHEAAGGAVEDNVLDQALLTLRALDQLFGWMEPEDAELTVSSLRLKNFYDFVLHTKRLLRTLATFTGYSDGYAYRYPAQEPIENVAELMKGIMISFSECYSDAQLERVMRHDYAENGWWWAGYWHFLDALLQRFLGANYLPWAPIDQLDVLEVLEVFLRDFCGEQ